MRAYSDRRPYCLGAPLARLEATIAFRMLAERMPGLRRTGPVRRRNSTAIRGPLHIPVSAGPAVRVLAAATQPDHVPYDSAREQTPA